MHGTTNIKSMIFCYKTIWDIVVELNLSGSSLSGSSIIRIDLSIRIYTYVP